MLLLPLLVASSTLLPRAGLWEFESGLAGVTGKAERKCLTQAEIEHFLVDPSNRHYACDMTGREVGGGKVRLKGVCTNRKHPDQKVGVAVAGTYSTDTISLKGQGTARVIGALELPVNISVTAHRVAATCTAEPAAAPPPSSTADGPSTEAPGSTPGG